MKKGLLEKYIHLYTGTYVKVDRGEFLFEEGTLMGCTGRRAIVEDNSLELHKVEFVDIKLPLRPIADMTIEEAMFVLRTVVHPQVEYTARDYRFSINEYLNAVISIDNDWFAEELVIGKSGAVWSKESPSRNVKVNATIVVYLLKQGFDIFSLIENGCAVDKTKLIA